MGLGDFVISDWWKKTEKDFIVWGRNENTPPRNFEPMVTAQNDIYMVNPKADDFEFNTITFFSDGEYLTSLTVSGTGGQSVAFTKEVRFSKGIHK